MAERDTFYVGILVFVVRGGKLLLGKRKNIVGDGTWGLPGGHLEHSESMKSAAARELAEETGLTADSLDFVGLVDMPREHYLLVGFLAQDVVGEVELREPDKCYEWQWFAFDQLPGEIFGGHDQLIKVFLEKSYFTDGI